MKKILFGLVLAGYAVAAPQKPLISKSSGGGFMAPEYAGHERCEVYSDKVVITHEMGMVQATALKLTEERKINLSGDVKLVIEKAREEKVEEKDNFLCDGPSTSIVANVGNEETGVLLYSTGGCGSPRKERTGVYSSKLRQIADLYCAKTFDFSSRE